MNRHHSQKQKRSLLNLHPIVFHSVRTSYKRIAPLTKYHFSTKSAVTIGVVATIGLSAVVAQAIQPKPTLNTQHNNSTSSQPANKTDDTTNVTVTQPVPPIGATAPAESPAAPSSKSLVIINGEQIPVSNGTITRSFSSDGSKTDVTVTIDNNSTTENSSSSTSSVNVNTSSRSSIIRSDVTHNTTRGSP